MKKEMHEYRSERNITPVPELDSSQSYLWRVSTLIYSGHIARIDGETVKDELAVLEQLYIELDPLMTDEERSKANEILTKAKSFNRARIKDLFIYLNRTAHAKGLIMQRQNPLKSFGGVD